MRTKDNLGFDSVIYGGTKELLHRSKFQKNRFAFRAIARRYLYFYGFELLDFLAPEDISRFISYEKRAFTAAELPLGEDFSKNAEWFLHEFCAGVLQERFVVVKEDSWPRPWREWDHKPLTDEELDALFNEVGNDPDLHLLLSFMLGVRIFSNRAGRMVYDNVHWQTWWAISRVMHRRHEYFTFGPILSAWLMEKYTKFQSLGCPKNILASNNAQTGDIWVKEAILMLFKRIGVDDQRSELRVEATAYDQFEKAGGSGQVEDGFCTYLSFRHLNELSANGRKLIFASQLYPKLKGCISLRDPYKRRRDWNNRDWNSPYQELMEG